jgi:hypothetical protein
MSDNGFAVDTDGLHNQLPGVQDLAARFRDIGKSLEAHLDALGECWGDDPSGKQFSELYATPRKQILEGVGNMGQAVDSLHDGIKTMAVNFGRVEAQNSDMAHGLKGTAVDLPSTPRGKTTK